MAIFDIQMAIFWRVRCQSGWIWAQSDNPVSLFHYWLNIFNFLNFQQDVNIFGKSVYLTVIGRRSNQFAGTRFLKRGSNHEVSVSLRCQKSIWSISCTFPHNLSNPIFFFFFLIASNPISLSPWDTVSHSDDISTSLVFELGLLCLADISPVLSLLRRLKLFIDFSPLCGYFHTQNMWLASIDLCCGGLAKSRDYLVSSCRYLLGLIFFSWGESEKTDLSLRHLLHIHAGR